MRHGHRYRFARGEGREGHRGRTSFARSINRAPRIDRIIELRVAQRKRRQFKPFQGEVDGRWCNDGCRDWDLAMWRNTGLEMRWGAQPEEEDEEHDEEEADGAWLCEEEPIAIPFVAVAAQTLTEATPWQRAQAQQERARWIYDASMAVPRRWSGMALALSRLERKARVKNAHAELRAAPPEPRVAKPLPPSVAIQGAPPCFYRHERLLHFAVPGSTGFPACWGSAAREPSKVLKPGQEEYDVVTDYFLHTLGQQSAQILQLVRLQNRRVYRGCLTPSGFGNPTMMFHGCRSEGNEASILNNGFQVSRCVSGGANYGTWFAYGAAYSNGGFVLTKGDGERRIFICLVSDRQVRLDNTTMRVVGQGCACPLWLLSYKVAASPVLPQPVKRDKKAPRTFFVVRDGRWVAEAPIDGK